VYLAFGEGGSSGGGKKGKERFRRLAFSPEGGEVERKEGGEKGEWQAAQRILSSPGQKRWERKRKKDGRGKKIASIFHERRGEKKGKGKKGEGGGNSFLSAFDALGKSTLTVACFAKRGKGKGLEGGKEKSPLGRAFHRFSQGGGKGDGMGGGKGKGRGKTSVGCFEQSYGEKPGKSGGGRGGGGRFWISNI